MLFRKSKTSSETKKDLYTYVLRSNKGFVIGRAMNPEVGSPCVQCVQSWLALKGIATEVTELADFNLRPDLIAELDKTSSPHLAYEIAPDGTCLKLDGPVFPHKACLCAKSNYSSVGDWSKRTNFVFSPIRSVESVRFPTSDGNLWITEVSGNSPMHENSVDGRGAADTKEKSRAIAVDAWLKAAAHADYSPRTFVPSICFQRPLEPFPFKEFEGKNIIENVGVGVDSDSAQLDALYGLARKTIVNRYSEIGKQPLLVVGITNWLRSRVPLFVLQRYDFHLLFYPNSFPCWIAGVIAVSRQDTAEAPIFSFGAHSKIHRAIDVALGNAVASCAVRPDENQFKAKTTTSSSSLSLWWTNWIYRCSKLSLRDLLHLEPYPESAEHWREYYRDGQDPVQQQHINHAHLPTALRHLVLLRSAEPVRGGKVIGLAQWVSARSKKD